MELKGGMAMRRKLILIPGFFLASFLAGALAGKYAFSQEKIILQDIVDTRKNSRTWDYCGDYRHVQLDNNRTWQYDVPETGYPDKDGNSKPASLDTDAPGVPDFRNHLKPKRKSAVRVIRSRNGGSMPPAQGPSSLVSGIPVFYY